MNRPRTTPEPPARLEALELRVLERVDAMGDEIVELARDLVRIPTVNPPGAHYRDCAAYLGRKLRRWGYQALELPAEGQPEHTPIHPRINLIATWPGERPRPALHINGHMDVVPAGAGWTVDPFAGRLQAGRLIGRGSSDMKAGLAAGVFALEAVRRAGLRFGGTAQLSATVDEESGGAAGVAHLCRRGLLTRDTCDYLIIPEPLGAERICLGHRGVLWLEVVTLGATAHGSMPFLGVSAIDLMVEFLARLQDQLGPELERRATAMPVEPPAARRATLNVNAIAGGQPAAQQLQSPCVADRCAVVLDRRFLIEERPAEVREEIAALLRRLAAENPAFRFELRDLMQVDPTWTAPGSELVQSTRAAVRRVTGAEAPLVASPGSYDQKHAVRIGGMEQCIAYGPGVLEQAHRPDEYCEIEDLLRATKVLALVCMDLLGVRE
jgi:succinyl-diaminopimelate desuccinylase